MQEQRQPTQGPATQQPSGQFTEPTGRTGSATGQTGQGGQIGQGGQMTQAGQQGQMGQSGQQKQMGLALQDVETPEQRAAVDAISRAVQVCGWCADQCIQAADPGMIECIRLCEDVTEIGEAALALLPRNSRYLQPILRAFEQAARACAQECGQHSHAHCQECAQVLPQATQSVQQYQASVGHQQTGF